MWAFLAVTFLVLAAVSTGSVLLSQTLARREALELAERTASGLTTYVIGPDVEGVLTGAPGKQKELDKHIQDRLADGSISAVLIWRPPGDVVYASSPAATAAAGRARAELRAAAQGRATSGIEFVPGPATPDGHDTMVAVYTPLSVGGTTLAVGVFFPYDNIHLDATLLRNRIILVTVGALVVLQLIQIPLGLSLFRRVRRHEGERAALLARSLDAADQERRAIAADLHDGPVQDLAGVAYALGSLRSVGSAKTEAVVDAALGAVREAVAWLRRLMTDVYPPDLSSSAMGTALSDLAESVRSSGSVVDVIIQPVPELSSEGAVVLYRTAKSALSEEWCAAAVHHSWVHYGPATLRGRPAVRMEVGHDCADAFPAASERDRVQADGLRLIDARIADLGGSLDIDTTGGKVLLTAVLPTSD